MRFVLILALFFPVVSFADIWETIFDGNCKSCHKNSSKGDAAPSAYEIQNAYKQAFTDKNEFIENMSKWLTSPNEKTALMKEDIKRYGLMPDVSIDLDTAKGVSSYIYEGDFVKP